MKNELEIFNNEEFGTIRTVTIDNVVWFVGKDVASALGYSNSSKALSDHVDEDDKLNNESLSSLGQRGGWLINESGLYNLVLGSKLPSAKKFKRWITSEVLPSIRKNGAYMTDDTLEKALTSPDFLIKLATQLKQEKEARIQAEQTIAEQKPLVDFANQVSNTTSLIDINQMAKLLKDEKIKIGRNRLFEILREKEILRDNNEPYQRYIDAGYFKVKELTYNTPYGSKVYVKTLITGKGQIWITEKLRKEFGCVSCC